MNRVYAIKKSVIINIFVGSIQKCNNNFRGNIFELRLLFVKSASPNVISIDGYFGMTTVDKTY